jgi:hypothetical protein
MDLDARDPEGPGAVEQDTDIDAGGLRWDVKDDEVVLPAGIPLRKLRRR